MILTDNLRAQLQLTQVLLSNLGLLYKFGDDNRVFLGHSYSATQVFLEVAVTVGDVHGCSAENVGRTNQAGITHSLTKLHSRLEGKKETGNRCEGQGNILIKTKTCLPQYAEKDPKLFFILILASKHFGLEIFQNILWYKPNLSYLGVRELLPLWLADSDGVQHSGELEPVLGTVDELG